MNIVAEYKEEIDRLRAERDVFYELLVDQVQYNSNIVREEAKTRVSQEVFQRLQHLPGGKER